MLIVRVFKAAHQRTGKKKDGTEFQIRFQEAEIIQENYRPRVIEITIQRGQDPYPEGLYTIAAGSFRPDRYYRVEMIYPTLTPLEEALKLGKRALDTWKSEKAA